MDQKDEVKSKVDIVELISSYLPLKKAGRNFAGLCPFHSEKTPSFMVSAERQVFKCFGCGEGGDVFTFLEKMEGWDFRETLEELAKRAGVKLKKFAPSNQSRTREKLIEINKLVSKFYAHLLNSHPLGERARKYLINRGIKAQTWEKFGLGYAPDSWDKTLSFLTSRKFAPADASQSGLIIARSGRDRSFYDRFRNRLMFPLRGATGDVLGFSARVIGESKDEPKYVNTPETPIFNKGSLLFGLDVARGAIRAKNETILVEGEFDVMSANQVGIENVVASKGTALTDKQVANLARICENVALCFDTDLAGDNASRRGIELLDIAGVGVKVINLGNHKDPDEFCQKDPAGFKKAIGEAINIYDYFIDSAIVRFDANSAEGKKKIGREVLQVLAKISDDFVRAHYIEKLAKVLDLDVALVASAVEKRLPNINFAEAAQIQNLNKMTLGLEEYFLALFVSGNEIEGRTLKFLAPDDFSNKDARDFWAWLHDIIKTSHRRQSGFGASATKAGLFSKILKKAPSDLVGFVDNLYLVNISPDFTDKQLWAAEVVKVAVRIKQASLKRQLSQISKSIKIAEIANNAKQIDILKRKFNNLAKQQKEAIL